MKKQNILFLCFTLYQSILQGSNAFNNDANYYLDRVDDLKPVGMHPQIDDLDVTATENLLIQSVLDGNSIAVEKILSNKKYIFSDKQVAQAIYYATSKDLHHITKLLANYANTNNLKVDFQSVDNQ